MKCKVCGKSFTKPFFDFPPYNEICQDYDCCLAIFWQNIIRQKDNLLFIDGRCYEVGKDDDLHPAWCGFGGQEFIVKRLDNLETIVTHNLRYLGIVPEKHKDVLSNNAIFIDKEMDYALYE